MFPLIRSMTKSKANWLRSDMQSHGATTCRIDGYRVHSRESIQFGNYRSYVPPSIFTCAASRFAHVPDARDFDLKSVLEVRGELTSN